MKKVINKIKFSSDLDIEYWASKSDNEKISAIQELREQYIRLFNKEEDYLESRKRL